MSEILSRRVLHEQATVTKVNSADREGYDAGAAEPGGRRILTNLALLNGDPAMRLT